MYTDICRATGCLNHTHDNLGGIDQQQISEPKNPHY